MELEGGSQMAVREDGPLFAVYPDNPTLGGAAWPQVMVGTYDVGGGPGGPYLSLPTDIKTSMEVSYPDAAVNAFGGVAAYSDWKVILYADIQSHFNSSIAMAGPWARRAELAAATTSARRLHTLP